MLWLYQSPSVPQKLLKYEPTSKWLIFKLPENKQMVFFQQDCSNLQALRWRHNDHPGVSNHQLHGCLLNRLFRRWWKKTSKLGVTGLCAGNSPGPVYSPHKGPVTRKMFPFDDVIMEVYNGFSRGIEPFALLFSMMPRISPRRFGVRLNMYADDGILYTSVATMWWTTNSMMTSSNGIIIRVTGHLCGEFTGPRWIPHTKASDAELWCFLCSAPE